MGGCRCTYRNCTIKSDGQVHLFHYPVFEKLRCHQWLLNAHRLDFLDLRVSQLKNRVVCQHHFKDDNFMNYKKDKLKFDAIPTEDGPYCDRREWNSKLVDMNKLCPIIPEDIENTHCAAYDKKTSYSLRYGDFLTNSEPSDLNDLQTNKINNSLHNLRKDIRKNILKDEPLGIENNNLCQNTLQNANKKDTQNLIKIQPHVINHIMKRIPVKGGKSNKSQINIISEKRIRNPLPIKGKFKKVTPSTTLPPPKKRPLYIVPEKIKNFTDNPNVLNNINFDKSYIVEVEFDPSQKTQDPSGLNNTLQSITQNSSIVECPLNNTLQSATQDSSIVQYPLNNTTQSVIQDSSIVQYPLNNTTQNVNQDSLIVQFPLNNTPQSSVKDESFVQYPLNDVNITQSDNKLQITISETAPKARIQEISASPQTKQLLRKVKLTPERKAAIDSKREFNKMLRNVIHACLDTKDSVDNNTDNMDSNRIEEIKKQLCLELQDTKKENEINNGRKLISIKSAAQNHSILKPSLQKPNTPVQTDEKSSLLTFLEARMQILESNVIKRIDQNTKQISELKEKFAKGPSKNCSTQTCENEETYKKFLFQEISKFLSPSCNSSVYEELFINKYSVKETAPPREKRRRR